MLSIEGNPRIGVPEHHGRINFLRARNGAAKYRQLKNKAK